MSSSKRGESSGSVGSRTKSQIDSMPGTSASDALTIEFQYYGGAIRNLASAMSNPVDRARAVLWVNKLFGAEYHVEVLREKRNRYLAALTVSMINDELIGVFEEAPPSGRLKDLTKMKIFNAPSAEWEKDTTWSDYVSTLPDNYKEIPCSYHCDGSCNQGFPDMGQQLDNASVTDKGTPRASIFYLLLSFAQEFMFLLYQIRPYAALMPCPEAKTKVAAWIQTLCGLSCVTCDKMKALRNDYAYVLYGYVRDLRVAGPFQDYPPGDTLAPLSEAAKNAAKKHPLTSPYSEEASSFLEIQPVVDEGAFCYIAVTGDFANPDALLPP